jgi:hypothetical protein
MASKISVVSSSASRQPEAWWGRLIDVLDAIVDLESFEHCNVVYNVALVNRACAGLGAEIDFM